MLHKNCTLTLNLYTVLYVQQEDAHPTFPIRARLQYPIPRMNIRHPFFYQFRLPAIFQKPSVLSANAYVQLVPRFPFAEARNAFRKAASPDSVFEINLDRSRDFAREETERYLRPTSEALNNEKPRSSVRDQRNMPCKNIIN